MRTLLTKYTYGAYDESLSVNAALFGFGLSTITCIASGKSLAKDLDDFMAASTDLATLGASVGCFVAGTTVKTEEGDKAIEEIEAGDKVLSYEATTGRFAYKEVMDVIAHDGVTELAHVTIDGETIDSTTNHPYFVVGYGYVDAGNLIEGDTVLLANGEEALHYRNGLGDGENLDADIVAGFEKRYDEILAEAETEYEEVPPSDYYREGYRLYRRLVKYRESQLLFLHALRVPTNNSVCERLTRVYKRKQKQATVFRSQENLEKLCDSLSVVYSLRPNAEDLFGEKIRKLKRP